MVMNNKLLFLKGKLVKSKYLILALLFSFFPKLVLASRAIPMYAPSDESWMLGLNAKFLGYNWSQVMENSSYYGVGFSFIFIPLMKLIKDSFLLYHIMLVSYILVNCGIVLCVYSILNKFINQDDGILNSILALAASYSVSLPIVYIYNEHILALLVYILIFILLKLYYFPRRRIFWTIWLVLILGYSLTIHTRAIIFWIAVILTVCVYFFFSKHWLVNMPVFCGIGLVSWIIGRRVVNWSLDYAWMVENGQQVHNSTVSFSGFELLFNLDAWKYFIDIILGQINAGIIFSGSFLVIAVIFTVIIIKKYIKYGSEEIYFLLAFFLGIQIIAAIGMQAVMWLKNVMIAVQGGEWWSSHLRAFSYIRYYWLYAAPLIIISIAYLFRTKRFMFQISYIYLFLTIFLQELWIKIIVPYIEKNVMVLRGNSANVMLAYSLKKLPSDSADYTYFIPAFLAILCIAIIVYWSLRKEKRILICVIFMLMSIYQYFYRGSVSIDVEKNWYLSVDKEYDAVNEIINLMADIPNIYMKNVDIYSYYEACFLLRENTIILLENMPEEDEYVVFSHERDIELARKSREFKLDNNEFMYIKGYEELSEKFGD